MQLENAELPMDVTLFGISIDVKPEQPENAELPIFVTLSPNLISLMDVIPANHDSTDLQFNSMEVKPLQPSNALRPMDVTPLPMVTQVRLEHF